MKKIFLLPLLILSMTAFAQKTSKQQDIQRLLTALLIKPTMQNMVSKGIEYFKKQKPLVPLQVWDNIKTTIDYTPYMTMVAVIFDSNYSQPEIKNLISQTDADKSKIPQFQNTVQKQLYNAGSEFGKNFAELLKNTLKSKGY